MDPPALPKEVQYTQFWCEENIYLLARQFIQDTAIDSRWEVFIVFISNATKTVALWNQRLTQESQRPVIWDYHAILVLRDNTTRNNPHPVTSWVYDFDSRSDGPTTWADYFVHTFSPVLPVEFQSTFRIVSGKQFVDNFASDRSHMLISQTEGADSVELVYYSPPPLYPCICGPRSADQGVTHNLTAFISMLPSIDGPGEIHTLLSADTFFSSTTNSVNGLLGLM